MTVSSSPSAKIRYADVDVIRGLALVMIMIFHLICDLDLYRVTYVDLFKNKFWLVYRDVSVFLFLGVMGGCLFLKHSRKIRWGVFFRRILRISLAALLVTLATYFFNPKYTVFLGILHFIVLASFVGLLFLHYPNLSLWLAFALLAVGYIGHINDPSHYLPYFAWVGFGSDKIPAFEFVPLIPYFAYPLLGIALTSYAFREGKDYLFIPLNPSRSVNRFLAFLGRHTLLIYLAQRPIDIGLLELFTRR